MLNKFAVVCDRKLVDLDFRLQNVEVTLMILEEKVTQLIVMVLFQKVPSDKIGYC